MIPLLEEFKKQEIHLALLDIMMPNIDGITVMEEIRKRYQQLTNYNIMFLITESWDLSDEDKAFLLNTTPGAVRTMRSRLAKKKV